MLVVGLDSVVYSASSSGIVLADSSVFEAYLFLLGSVLVVVFCCLQCVSAHLMTWDSCSLGLPPNIKPHTVINIIGVLNFKSRGK